MLQGRNILLTGASSGVGRHLATILAAESAHVICCARRSADLKSLVSEIEAAGGKATAQTCDVSDAASIEQAFDAGEAAAGPIDSVIVNAGINHAGPAARLPVDALDQILSVNLRGAFLTAREGARRMIASGPPKESQPRRIVFIASILGKRAQAGAAAYSATKAGLLMLAKSLALEWARHEINVNAILPGYMPTDIVADWFASDAGKAQVDGWPRKRLMPVSDLDPALLFLLSPQARSVSGSDLTVDDTQSLA
ncbi:MAG: SDR family oxidoreductase [Sphingomonadales bacterium]|nr:SDR family oxidoreductase [Sphingomonadales bacterium]MBK9004904.1 SDR family oxidoreductase [Sphingomonadales bacterium]MBK9267367.1 SDR family oxidoreductase [Sphingomonadales bacterium]MBP6434063.1 SDR family oxidoreductase [Sphingorhabdus sp.]